MAYFHNGWLDPIGRQWALPLICRMSMERGLKKETPMDTRSLYVVGGSAVLTLLLAVGCVPQNGGSGGSSGGSVRGVTFAKSYGGDGYDQASAVAPTVDGGFIMAGVVNARHRRIAQGVLAGFEDGDLWVQKLDADGNVEISRSYGDQVLGMDSVADIRRTGDGGHIVTGQSSDDRVRVAKLDGNGHVSWARSYDSGRQDGPFSSLSEDPRRIRPTRDGGYVVVGVSTATGSNGRKLDNALVMRLGAAGELRWRRTFDENAGDLGLPRFDDPRLAQALDVIELSTPRSGFIVVGQTAAIVDLFPFGLRAGLLMRLTDSGDVLWSRPGRFDNRFDYSDADMSDGVSPDETEFWRFAGVTETLDRRLVAVGSVSGRGDPAEEGALAVWFKEDGALRTSTLDNTLGPAEAVVPSSLTAITIGRSKRQGEIYVHKQAETGALFTRMFPTGPLQRINQDKLERLDLRLAADGSIVMAGEDDGEILVRRLDRDGLPLMSQRYTSVEGSSAPLLISQAIEFASDGGVLVGGMALDTNRNRIGGRLLRADATGAVLWRRGHRSVTALDAPDQARAIAQTTDGGYIVAGSTRTVVTADGRPLQQAWLLKLRPDLSVQWQRVYGDSPSESRALVLQPGGGYLLAATVLGDAWVLALDTDSTVLWQTPLGTAGRTDAVALRATADGGTIVLFTMALGGGGRDANATALARLDPGGTVQWQRQYSLGPLPPGTPGAGFLDGAAVDLAHGGGYVVAGRGTADLGGIDIVVFRVDDTGALVWQHAYGGADEDRALSLRATPDRGYILAGLSRSFSTSPPCLPESPGPETACGDIWVLKLNEFGRIGVDASGNRLLRPLTFDRILATGLDDAAYAVEATPDGGFIVAGVTNGITGNADAWLLKLGPDGGISEGCPAGLTPRFAPTNIFGTADVRTVILGPVAATADLEPLDTSLTPFDPAVLAARQCSGDLLAPTQQLTLRVTGQGTVTASGLPRTLVCTAPATCSEVFDQDSTVSIVLEPAPGWQAASFSGSCRADNLSLVMDGPRSCGVTFARIPGQSILTVVINGSGGRVTEGTRIDCRSDGVGDCIEVVNTGSQLVLQATGTNVNQAFNGFSGCDTVLDNHCTVHVRTDRTVTAHFSDMARLAVLVDGPGSVSSTPSGINCTRRGDLMSCTQDYAPDTSVTLTATPSAGFEAWEGCDSASGTVCTVQMSRSRSVLARFSGDPASSLLIITRPGSGTGRITGPGIDCGLDCAETYATGTMVTLQATPEAGSRFNGWSGCDTSSSLPSGGQCTVNVSARRTVAADFSVAVFTLTVTRNGAGTVTSTPAGITCGPDCSEDYTANTVVTLVPTATPGQQFSAWSGDADCSDGQVTMDAHKTCIATFVPTGPANFLLIVERTQNPAGNGTVTSLPPGITCGIDCDAEYVPGTQVVLTATPDATSVLQRWEGCDSVSGPQCTVAVNVNNRRVSAVFGRRE